MSLQLINPMVRQLARVYICTVWQLVVPLYGYLLSDLSLICLFSSFCATTSTKEYLFYFLPYYLLLVIFLHLSQCSRISNFNFVSFKTKTVCLKTNLSYAAATVNAITSLACVELHHFHLTYYKCLIRKKKIIQKEMWGTNNTTQTSKHR